jgi:type II secretory pathway component PulK
MLIVLWALLLLGTLAMSFAFAMRTEAQASRNGMDGIRAYYQARTGVGRAFVLLRSLPPDNVTKVPVSGGDSEAGYEARIEHAGGKVDINLAPELLLKGILKQAGLPEAEAEAMGDAILDWRDGDDDPRGSGAEAPYYAGLPEPIRPRNGKLESIEELRSMRGVTPEFYERVLSKVFTVYGGTLQVNVNDAPVEVLRALPGFTPEAADRLVRRRKESPFRSHAELSAFLGEEGVRTEALPYLSTASFSRRFTITSTGTSGGTVVRVVRCTIDLAGGGPGMVTVVRWEDQVSLGEEER